MSILLIDLLLIACTAAVTLNCTPPVDLPQCVVCEGCRSPNFDDSVNLQATVNNATSRFFTDGDGQSAHRFAALVKKGNQTLAQFKVTPDAKDVYRYFTVNIAVPGRKLSEVYQMTNVLLDGNNKGQGVGCQYTFPNPLDQIEDNLSVTDMDPVPADRCF